MGFRTGDEIVEIEGEIEAQTAKAYLIIPTIGEQCWIPKSQVRDVKDTNDPKVKVFFLTEWIARKNGLI